jgi:O-antigen/teichoic acid export membrane protein
MSYSKFIKHVSILVSGTVFAQFIAFGFSLALARIYDGEDFGYFSSFIAILSILSILATGSYDKALMFARSTRRALSLIVLVLSIAVVTSLIITLATLLLLFFRIDLPLGLSYFDTIILLPIALIATVSMQLFIYQSLREGQIGKLSSIKVFQSIVTGGTQVVGGIAGGKWIVTGYIAGLLFYMPFMIQRLRLWAKLLSRRIWLSTWASAKKYKRYPRYVCPNELIDVASHQIPMLLIGIFFSIATLGQYGFAQRILAAPSALIGQAVSQIFFKSITAQEISQSEILSLMIRIWLIMSLIGVVPFYLLFLSGESIFLWVFGSVWAEAGQMAEALAALLFFRFVSSPTSTIYYKLNLQRAQLIYCIIAFIVRTLPIFLIFQGFGIIQVLIVQVVGEICVIIAFNITALIAIKKMNTI